MDLMADDSWMSSYFPIPTLNACRTVSLLEVMRGKAQEQRLKSMGA